jgi:DNA-binding NtrC family response regulator
VPRALRVCSGTRLAIAKAVIDTPDAVRLRPVATVLLVDDDPGVRFALTEVLADRGYRVITAGSGAQALNLLDGVDVVVTDLSMPGMDGLELVAQIRARTPGLPVILLTAHGSENMVRIASSRGACGCLSKPFDIDEIAHVIEQARAGRAP